jgi:hypothetical protein
MVEKNTRDGVAFLNRRAGKEVGSITGLMGVRPFVYKNTELHVTTPKKSILNPASPPAMTRGGNLLF